MRIDSNTQLNFVIGSPIKQSKSPDIHAKMYKVLNINAVLIAIDTPNLPDFVQSMKTLNAGMCAITLPYKTDILQYVDSMSEEVKALGAANTLINREGKIHALNTDVHGIQSGLEDVELKNKNVLIIGAGGAARATAYALKDSNVHIYWMNRTEDKVKLLIQTFGGTYLDADQARTRDIDIIINTTSVGMHPHVDESPLPAYRFKPNQTVFDLIYNPQVTRLLREARQAGAHGISGERLFVEQAIKQIEFCYDVKVDARCRNELHDY